MVVAGKVEDAADVEEDAKDGGGEHHHPLQHLLHLFLHSQQHPCLPPRVRQGSVKNTSLLSTEKMSILL